MMVVFVAMMMGSRISLMHITSPRVLRFVLRIVQQRIIITPLFAWMNIKQVQMQITLWAGN